MAPSKRRRTSGPTASTAKPSQQSTLAFNRTKPNLPSHEPANKIAKPSVAKPPLKSHKGEKPATPSPQVADVHVPATKTEEAPPEDGVEEPVVVEDDDEARARRISETQIKQYWAAKERARKAGRVHQEGLGVREKVLREFDMTSRYGPSIGIDRLKRWKRARELGFEPPVEVLAVLLKNEDEGTEGKDGLGQKSIMDELIMSSRIAGRDVAAET